MSYIDEDVLFGRGNGTNHHPGNKYYREVVKERKEEYLNSKLGDKGKIAREILKLVHERGGRFLESTKKDDLSKVGEKEYIEVDEVKAVNKITQSLREQPKSQKELKKAKLKLRSDNVKPQKFLRAGRSFPYAGDRGPSSSSKMNPIQNDPNLMAIEQRRLATEINALQTAIISNNLIIQQQQQQSELQQNAASLLGTNQLGLPMGHNRMPQEALNQRMLQNLSLAAANQQGLGSSQHVRVPNIAEQKIDLNPYGIQASPLGSPCYPSSMQPPCLSPATQQSVPAAVDPQINGYRIDRAKASSPDHKSIQPHGAPSSENSKASFPLTSTHDAALLNQPRAPTSILRGPHAHATTVPSVCEQRPSAFSTPPVLHEDISSLHEGNTILAKDHSLSLDVLDEATENVSGTEVAFDFVPKRQTSHQNEISDARKRQNRQKSVEFADCGPPAVAHDNQEIRDYLHSRLRSDDTVAKEILNDLSGQSSSASNVAESRLLSRVLSDESIPEHVLDELASPSRNRESSVCITKILRDVEDHPICHIDREISDLLDEKLVLEASEMKSEVDVHQCWDGRKPFDV